MTLYRVRLVLDCYVKAEDEGHARDVVADTVDDLFVECNRMEKVVTLYNHAKEVPSVQH